MNSIIGFSELALDDNISPKTEQYLSNICDNAKWLLNIINDILDSAKIESGKVQLENIPFDLKDVIDQCTENLLPKFDDKGIALFCYVEDFPGKKLLGDPVRLRQIFLNLLSNAVKFTEKGTVKLLTSLIDSDDTHVVIKFEVKDTGIGMSRQQVDRIFDPFNQADDSITRKFGGTGLGLPITKGIIEMMGSKLTVESIPGNGSLFGFILAFDYIESDETEAKGVILSDLEKPHFDAEILVCEDNYMNQQVICEHLARVGIKTVVAHNGQESVDIVKERMNNPEFNDTPFDLIFMDIHMPVMDGLEATTQMAQMGMKTPVLALTANIISTDIELYKKCGMVDCLGKPFTSQELWKCLMNYLPVVEIEILNKSRQSAEDEETLNQLRLHFFRHNQDTIENIKKAVADGDIVLAHRLTHTVKSNAGQIGEKQLQKLAAETDSMLINGVNRLKKNQLSLLEAEMRLVLNRLAPLAEQMKGVVETVDTQKALEIISILEPLLKDSKPESMNLLDKIRSIPDSNELAHYVEDFEFSKAHEELCKLKERLEETNE